MNKETFAQYISENMAITSSQADMVIDIFTSNLAQAMFEGNPVDLEDFGSFIPSIKLKSEDNKDCNIKSHISQNTMFVPGRLLKNDCPNL